ncbi:MAG: hypothetical protein PHO53_06230, partial [Actinomycetota bacterium]|nr:hypothetical protein [Actinomycetota bacterium]
MNLIKKRKCSFKLASLFLAALLALGISSVLYPNFALAEPVIHWQDNGVLLSTAGEDPGEREGAIGITPDGAGGAIAVWI